MVRYYVGGQDPQDLPLGTYYIHTRSISRGKNAGTSKTSVFQVKAKGNTHYWSKLKVLSATGLPPPLSARRLNLEADDAAIRAYEQGKTVYLHTAFNHEGEKPTSSFVLRRRREFSGSDNYHYYWTASSTGLTNC